MYAHVFHSIDILPLEFILFNKVLSNLIDFADGLFPFNHTMGIYRHGYTFRYLPPPPISAVFHHAKLPVFHSLLTFTVITKLKCTPIRWPAITFTAWAPIAQDRKTYAW